MVEFLSASAQTFDLRAWGKGSFGVDAQVGMGSGRAQVVLTGAPIG